MQLHAKASVICLASLLALSGCTSLPRSGPNDRDIRRQADFHLAADKNERAPYALVDLTANLLSYFPTRKYDSFSSGFGPTRRGAPTLPLGIGDIVAVTLFESAAGGLFIPAEAGSRAGNFVTLPNQTIDTQGTLSVPYAGRIRAAGRLPEEVQAEIERRLADRAIEPQAIITLVESRSGQVSVLGDVNASTRIDINPSGERVLDAISKAGGLSAPGRETFITLQRGQTTATVPFDELVNNPRENIYLYPGDVVYVNRERRTYLAFGATGLSGRIDFEESDLTLAEGIGKAGGLLDSRADPGQVFLYRLVDADTLRKLGVPFDAKDSGAFPVIFRLNMRDPRALFISQNFPMQDKDILYVSNANSVEVVKFFDIINSVSSGVAGPAADAVTIQAANRTLR